MNMAQSAGRVYALLADGTTVEIRPAGPGDFGAVKAMHEAMSPDNSYMRFFNLSRLAAETEAHRICRDPQPGQVALLALANGEDAPAGAADTEVAVKVTDDHVFGSLVVLGLSGPDARASDVPAEQAARLTPLTDTDADKLIRSVRSAPLHPGALRELLLRVSRFAEDLPEVSELDLSPVIAGPERASVLGACVKVTPSQPQDPFLRKLR